MKYINKIKSALLTIYNNIKYISWNDLEYLDEKDKLTEKNTLQKYLIISDVS